MTDKPSCCAGVVRRADFGDAYAVDCDVCEQPAILQPEINECATDGEILSAVCRAEERLIELRSRPLPEIDVKALLAAWDKEQCYD